MGHFYVFVSIGPGGIGCVCTAACVKDVLYGSFHMCVWTHCVSAVQFLQKGVVRAFGEAALLIDKSQHAQFLKGNQTEEQDRVKHTSFMMELVIMGHIWLLLL